MKTILAVGAHIGDAELTSGIILANESLKGNKVITVALTGGERGNPPNMTVEEYLVQKKQEANIFIKKLGEQNEAIIFAIPDGELIASEDIKLSLASIIRKYKPSMILGHWEKSMHKDHEAASIITQDAQFYAGIDMGDKVKGQRHYAPLYMMENWEDMEEFEPFVYFKVTDTAFELWKNAIQNHWFVMNSKSFAYFTYYNSLAKVRGCLAKSNYAVAANVKSHAKKRIVDLTVE